MDIIAEAFRMLREQEKITEKRDPSKTDSILKSLYDQVLCSLTDAGINDVNYDVPFANSEKYASRYVLGDRDFEQDRESGIRNYARITIRKTPSIINISQFDVISKKKGFNIDDYSDDEINTLRTMDAQTSDAPQSFDFAKKVADYYGLEYKEYSSFIEIRIPDPFAPVMVDKIVPARRKRYAHVLATAPQRELAMAESISNDLFMLVLDDAADESKLIEITKHFKGEIKSNVDNQKVFVAKKSVVDKAFKALVKKYPDVGVSSLACDPAIDLSEGILDKFKKNIKEKIVDGKDLKPGNLVIGQYRDDGDDEFNNAPESTFPKLRKVKKVEPFQDGVDVRFTDGGNAQFIDGIKARVLVKESVDELEEGIFNKQKKTKETIINPLDLKKGDLVIGMYRDDGDDEFNNAPESTFPKPRKVKNIRTYKDGDTNMVDVQFTDGNMAISDDIYARVLVNEDYESNSMQEGLFDKKNKDCKTKEVSPDQVKVGDKIKLKSGEIVKVKKIIKNDSGFNFIHSSGNSDVGSKCTVDLCENVAIQERLEESVDTSLPVTLLGADVVREYIENIPEITGNRPPQPFSVGYMRELISEIPSAYRGGRGSADQPYVRIFKCTELSRVFTGATYNNVASTKAMRAETGKEPSGDKTRFQLGAEKKIGISATGSEQLQCYPRRDCTIKTKYFMSLNDEDLREVSKDDIDMYLTPSARNGHKTNVFRFKLSQIYKIGNLGRSVM